MWWTVILLEASIGSSSRCWWLHVSAHVKFSKDSVSWHAVVHSFWFVIVEMWESACTIDSIEEWHVGVSIVDGIAVLTMKELKNIVLYDWILGLSCIHRSGCINRSSISKSEHVFVLLVLESVFIHINESLWISKTGLHNEVMWLAWWVDGSRVKFFLNSLPRVNVSENSNLFSTRACFDREHFPTKHNLDSALCTFIKSNFIRVWESVDLFVWSPVLNCCILSSETSEFVLSHHMLEVQGIEIASFSLVWELWRVDNVVTGKTLISVVKVTFSVVSVKIVQSMNPSVVGLFTMLKVS